MEQMEVEQIARVIVRDYGLPLKLCKVSMQPNGECTVGFVDAYSGLETVSVGVWCDARVSAYGIRESLKRALDVDG
jgi:hypothetical protein